MKYSGLFSNSSLPLLARTNAIIPLTNPTKPKQKQVGIDTIPRTNVAVEFGTDF